MIDRTDEADAESGPSRRGRLSLRWEMAIWFATLLALLEGGVVLTVLFLHRHAATTAFDAVLSEEARLAAAAVATDRHRLLTSDLRLAGLAIDSESGGTLGLVRLGIFTADGMLLRVTDRTVETEIDLWRAAGTDAVEWTTPEGQRRRGMAAPIAGTAWSLWLSSGLDRQSARTRPVRIAIISSAALAVGVAGFGGWLMAGVALRPLAELTRLATTMTPDSIGLGVPLGNSSAEVAQLKRELDRALRRLDRAFRAQERFASNVAHELKTPIATILTEAQVLREAGGSDEGEMGFAESVEEEMRRLGRLVDGFLLLTRVQDGERVVRGRHTDPNELIMAVVERLTPMARAHGVSVRAMLLEGEDSPQIEGDSDLLETMIENLVRNAIRFSPPDKPVEVRAERTPKEVRIVVEDQGPGLPPELGDRIFDRFVQAPAEQQSGRGHGLGLQIAQGIAELHGGRITIEPRSGTGCRFVVWLRGVREAKVP